MPLFRARSFVKYYIPVRLRTVSSFASASNSIVNQTSMPKKVLIEEKTSDEILNRILFPDVGPNVSREEVCVDYVRQLCAAGGLQVAARLLRSLNGKNIFFGPSPYNCILEAADIKNDFDMLAQVFKDLLVSCTSIGLTSYIIVGRAFGKPRNPAMLLNFIKDICGLGLPRIDVVLNRIIFGLAKCGHVDSALLVFDHLKSSKSKPNLVTYNTILAILGRCGRLEDMLHEFASMTAIDLIPDVVTYNTILNSLRKMGRFDLCLVYYKEMSDRGIQPDLLTFKALIESLGRSGNIEDALKAFYDMKVKRIFPSIYIYRALVFSLERVGKAGLALKFSTEMNRLFPEIVVPRSFHYENR
ncbi:pentatricopeptide repeat-containing protein At1g11900-like [Andrographis paniculata]|uniref:pentatricopeptide repeat-containing protein At1g11900-like n=1 Tax=Andrographis paniculata TaxID=175694 RepID=UPI0021E83318|nr:pentatricopeptide repeat-containing protein At1g11900-like [Andrographis paniculata]